MIKQQTNIELTQENLAQIKDRLRIISHKITDDNGKYVFDYTYGRLYILSSVIDEPEYTKQNCQETGQEMFKDLVKLTESLEILYPDKKEYGLKYYFIFGIVAGTILSILLP